MKHHGKFSSREQQGQQLDSATQQAQQARDFASTEELLRYDAAQTAVPAIIAQRLAKSAEGLPRPKKSWWARLFGK